MDLDTASTEPATTVAPEIINDLMQTVDKRLKDAEAKAASRLDAFEARLARPGLITSSAIEPSDEVKAFADYLARGDRATETKMLRVADDRTAGYLAPEEMSAEMVRNLVEFSPIRSIASVRTITAPSIRYPKRTAITNARWTAEAEETTGSEPAFGMIEVPTHELTTHVDISNQLLADSAGAAEAEVRLALAEDFSKKESVAFVAGNGVAQPMGMLTDTTVPYIATGNASTLGTNPADMLIAALYALPATYRNRATWVMNGSTLAAIRKLKDGTTGNYLWQPSYQAGQPETILGRPVVEAIDMPDIGAGAEPIIFGDFDAAYRIVDRLDLTVLVNPYVLATKGVTRMHATRRVGAAVIRPAALRKIRCAVS